MKNDLYALLGFAEAVEKYTAENKNKSLEGLLDIDIQSLKKSIADSIGSFDVSSNKESLKLGESVFKQFVKEKEVSEKKNVVEELGKIFDVDFELEISEEKEAKLKIDDLLASYDSEYVDEEEVEEVKEETVEVAKEETKEEVAAENFETIINRIIGINEVEEDDFKGEIFHSVKLPEPNPVVGEIIKDNNEFVDTVVGAICEIVTGSIGTFVVNDEVKKEIKPIEIKAKETSFEKKEKEEVVFCPSLEVSELMIKIAKETIGEFEPIEEVKEETAEEVLEDEVNEEVIQEEAVEIIDDKELVEEIKGAFESLEESNSYEEPEIVFEEDNDFGLDENDEFLKAIRKAAGFDETENEENENTPLFQPAPEELDSLIEELEANAKEAEEKETAAENPIEQVSVYEEVNAETQEDLLKSLSGLINYGQFDEVAEENTEVEDQNEEPVREAQYIFNPLGDEQDHYVVSDDQDEEVEISEETDEEIVEEVSEEDLSTDQELALRFIENPGLDVVFDGDDIVYSSYDEVEEKEETEVAKEEIASTEENELPIENEVSQEELEENIDEVINELSEEPVEEEVVLDENERYVDDLLNNYEFSNSRVNEILDAREEVYKVISKMYPYLNYAFIKSAYDLKDSISEEYEEGKEIIILHRTTFSDLEDLRKYAEIMMNHAYQVNVDENQMMVDTLKAYKNVDGLILNSIFEVANQVNLLNGEYEGYCVLTDLDKMSV